MSVSMTAAAILAGGKARRFSGIDKCRLVVEGRTIIARQVDVLQQVAGELFVVAGDAARFADLGLPVHADRIADRGVIGGVYTALEVAQAPLVIVVGCDLPYLDVRLLERLVELAAGADGAWVRTPRGVEPLLSCYQRSARTTLRDQIDRGRLKAADLGSVLRMAELDTSEVERFGSAARLLSNINTPDDYDKLTNVH